MWYHIDLCINQESITSKNDLKYHEYYFINNMNEYQYKWGEFIIEQLVINICWNTIHQWMNVNEWITLISLVVVYF